MVGEGTAFKGVLELSHGIQVHGTLEGERLATDQGLVVGSEGTVRSDVIEVTDATISGRVIGAVKASGRVCLLAGSVFVGQIQTRRLVVEEGALLRPE